jgi:hypothetical protein
MNNPSPAELIPIIVSLSQNALANVPYTRGIGRHNVSNLIYVPLTALNASADPIAIVRSNHVPLNQICDPFQETRCMSRVTTSQERRLNVNSSKMHIFGRNAFLNM